MGWWWVGGDRWLVGGWFVGGGWVGGGWVGDGWMVDGWWVGVVWVGEWWFGGARVVGGYWVVGGLVVSGVIDWLFAPSMEKQGSTGWLPPVNKVEPLHSTCWWLPAAD